MLYCMNCGAPLQDEDLFCGECGAPVGEEPKKICVHCGEELEADTLFCPNCGYRVIEDPDSERVSDEKPDEKEKEEAERNRTAEQNQEEERTGTKERPGTEESAGTGERPGTEEGSGTGEERRAEERIRAEEREAQKAYREEQEALLDEARKKLWQEQQRYQNEKKENERTVSRLNDQLTDRRDALSKWKKAGVAGFILAAVLLVLLGGTAVNYMDKYNSLNRIYRNYRDDVREKEQEFDSQKALLKETQTELDERTSLLNELEKKFSKLKNFSDSDVMIKIEKVYNAEKGLDEISTDLKASEMRYLTVDYKVYVSDNGPEQPVTIDIDIYGPDGALKLGTGNTGDHTDTKQVSSGDSRSWGFGNATTSTYRTGWYVIKFLYQEVEIAAQPVYIR